MTKQATVEALPHGTIVGRTAGVAFRQCWKPAPSCVVDLDDMQFAVDCLIDRITEIDKSRSCGAYLFVDPETQQAYVISEERSVAQAWIRERIGWLVGFYQTRFQKGSRLPFIGPTAEGLRDDLIEHLRGAA